MCLNPNKRAVKTHVEYETDAWISVFNVTLSLSRVIKVYGEAFGGKADSGTLELVGAIGTVMHHIFMVCTLVEDRLDRTKFPPPSFHTVSFGGKEYKTVDFDVSEGWVSFHHALHWLLAELCKHVDLLTEEKLMAVGVQGGLRGVFLRVHEQAILNVIDFPLRGMNYFFVLALTCLSEIFDVPSPSYDCSNPHWPLGSQWVRHSGSTTPLS